MLISELFKAVILFTLPNDEYTAGDYRAESFNVYRHSERELDLNH